MKKKIFGLFCALIISTFMITNVSALEISTSGNDVVQEGEYNSLRLAAGQNVTSTATIDGISLIAANGIDAKGHVTYGLYAGNSLTINEYVEKDMFAAGNVITVGEEAVVTRDAYIAGNSVIVKSNIGRDLRAGGSTIDISNITINGDAYIYAEKIIMNESTTIIGKLTYPDDSKITGMESASIGSTNIVKGTNIEVDINPMSRVYSFIISVVAAFIVMLVLFFIIPSSKEKLEKTDLNVKPMVKTMATGLLVLIVAPIAIIISLFTGVLTPLALIALVVCIIAIYLSTLLSAYIVGHLLNKKLFKNESVYLSLVLGIFLVKVLVLIPYLGTWISILALLYGLGLIYKFIASRGK